MVFFFVGNDDACNKGDRFGLLPFKLMTEINEAAGKIIFLSTLFLSLYTI